ncbi:MAG: DoxX family membrane protein [Flavobacteriia bacterium]|nr:DoxX family membrane protein [Flavobacteriia bacterium]
MKYLTHLIRFLVGALFIFSGLVKLNDPMGLSFKLHDYFAPDVLNMEWLNPFTLELALFVIILEVLLGVALLLGYQKKGTLLLLSGMIVFFTFLTFYSAYFNKVTDCGCFGDAIPLTPWQSFYKDVILSLAILILWLGQRHIQRLSQKRWIEGMLLLCLVACSLLANSVLQHLPFKDFRPYAVGKSIKEGMMSAEERGLDPTEYGTIYTLKNDQTGELQVVDSKAYIEDEWWKRSEWVIQDELTEQKLIKKGYEPPIHDFEFMIDDEDRTEAYLSAPSVLFVVSRKLETANADALSAIGLLAQECAANGIQVIAGSASSEETIAEFRTSHQWDFPMAMMDETTLKTVVRTNPGVLLLQEGKVVGKWAHVDLPSVDELLNLL